MKRQPGYLPEFNDMVAKVASDYRFEQRQRQMREAEVRLVSKYRIEQCNPPPQPASGNGPLPDRCRSVVMAPLKGWTGCVGGTAKFTRKAGSK
ncbi:MAG: hypothetical protein OXP11_22070 [Gammaproteobacteria bacterium]|nr:hypothetical protein [Gammaproteobacteria bacterium]